MFPCFRVLGHGPSLVFPCFCVLDQALSPLPTIGCPSPTEPIAAEDFGRSTQRASYTGKFCDQHHAVRPSSLAPCMQSRSPLLNPNQEIRAARNLWTMNAVSPSSQTPDEVRAATRIQAVSRGRRVRRTNKWRGAAHIVCGANSLLKKIRITHMSQLPLAIDRSVVTIEAKDQEQLDHLHLWEQGDEALYTREALEARYANRSHDGVWKLLNLWWEAAMASNSGKDRMPKAAYVAVYARICKVLLEETEEWDEAEVIRLVEESWQTDSRGKGSLTRTMFNDSLFELADMWCVHSPCLELSRPRASRLRRRTELPSVPNNSTQITSHGLIIECLYANSIARCVSQDVDGRGAGVRRLPPSAARCLLPRGDCRRGRRHRLAWQWCEWRCGRRSWSWWWWRQCRRRRQRRRRWRCWWGGQRWQ